MERIMSDFKSKLPDLKELGDITGKLFKDIKSSVSEIINDYKAKHAKETASKPKETAAKASTEAAPKKAAAKPKTAKASAKPKDKK